MVDIAEEEIPPTDMHHVVATTEDRELPTDYRPNIWSQEGPVLVATWASAVEISGE